MGLESDELNNTSTYLFSIDNRSFFLVDMVGIPNSYTWESVKEVMKEEPRYLAFAAITGYQLYTWYDTRKYCSKCGTSFTKRKKSRSLYCPSCGFTEYPKIAPSVIIGVVHDDQLLLANYPNYDKYALLAGFAEVGETLEETVAREVQEEVGLKVKSVRYYKSQPWALSDNLLIGFYCEVEDPSQITLDTNELSNAAWFRREDIPLDPDYTDGSLTYEMIRAFKNGEV